MKDILDKLIESLDGGNILLAIVIVCVALVFNYKKIIDFLEERKKARLEKLSNALKCDYVSGLTKKHIEEELELEHFKAVSGMSLERGFREAVIGAHKNTNGNLSFTVFKRALPHLKYKDSVLSVQISRFDIMSYYFNLIFGFLLAFSGLIFMVITSQISDINIPQFFSLFGMGIFFILVALFMLSETFSVKSARFVQEELQKNHNNSRQSDAQNTRATA